MTSLLDLSPDLLGHIAMLTGMHIVSAPKHTYRFNEYSGAFQISRVFRDVWKTHVKQHLPTVLVRDLGVKNAYIAAMWANRGDIIKTMKHTNFTNGDLLRLIELACEEGKLKALKGILSTFNCRGIKEHPERASVPVYAALKGHKMSVINYLETTGFPLKMEHLSNVDTRTFVYVIKRYKQIERLFLEAVNMSILRAVKLMVPYMNPTSINNVLCNAEHISIDIATVLLDRFH